MDPSPVAVINPLFCAPHPIDLAFTTKPPGEKKSGQLAAVDSAGNVLFRSKYSPWGGFTQLQDAAGHTILTMKAKFRTMHNRWQAFRGESTETKDLVFSIKRSSAFQFHEEWFVHVAANTEEQNCDFKIAGSYSKKNYTIFKGDSSSVVAQLTKEHKLINLPLKKRAFGAAISANCDYAFVVALITIFHAVSSDATRKAVIIGASVGASAGASSC